MPKREKFIFQAAVPGPLAADQKAAAGALGLSSQDFAFRTSQLPVTKRTKGGEVRIIDSSKVQRVHHDCSRDRYRPSGRDTRTALASQRRRMAILHQRFRKNDRVRYRRPRAHDDFQAGDVGYVLKTLPHYIQNTGDTDLRFLEMFKSSFYQDLALSEWLTHTPPELVIAHLGIDKGTLDAMPRDEVVVMPK